MAKSDAGVWVGRVSCGCRVIWQLVGHEADHLLSVLEREGSASAELSDQSAVAHGLQSEPCRGHPGIRKERLDAAQQLRVGHDLHAQQYMTNFL